MDYNEKVVELKFALYPCISQMYLVKEGKISYDEAKVEVEGWIDRCPHDVKDYFKSYHTSGDTPSWVGQELSIEVWQSLEFFEII